MIRRTLVLTGHSLRRQRGVLIGLGLLLAGFQFLLTEVAAYLLEERAFSQLAELMPEFVRTAIGPSALGFMSYNGIVSLGYFHPIVLTALVGLMIAIAAEPAGEVETRFVDLALARPIVRVEVITRTVLVLAVAGGLMVASMVAGTLTGLACCAPEGADPPSLSVLLSLAACLAAVMAAWAGIGLAVSAAARRRAVGGTVTGVAAFAAYLLDYLGRAWAPASAFGRLSPFHYFEPLPIVMGQPVSLRNLSVLAALAVVGTVVGYVAFDRRDL